MKYTVATRFKEECLTEIPESMRSRQWLYTHEFHRRSEAQAQAETWRRHPDNYQSEFLVMPILDERGFVFLDQNTRPFYCRLWGGEPWLFYWHRKKQWVSLRQVDLAEVATYPENLTDREQQIYHETHLKSERRHGALKAAHDVKNPPRSAEPEIQEVKK